MTEIQCLSGICHLGEGPVWNGRLQTIFWTDIYNRRLWMYRPDSGESRIFWEGELQVGGFAFTQNGGVVLCSDRGVYLLNPENAMELCSENRNFANSEKVKRRSDGKEAENSRACCVYPEPVLLFDIPMRESEMFNDITVDPAGRIFAGTISRPDFTGGILYRLEKGKEPVAVLRDLYCSNGMTFSLDEKSFFHTDSTTKTIMEYDYDRSTGNISNPRVFFKGTEEIGSPDGMTMDSEGYIWSAFWGGSCVRRLGPCGRIMEEMPVPARQPSSVMFGGSNLEELYITSACENAHDILTGYNKDGVFLGGPLYRCIPGVTGRPEWLANF